MAQTGRDSASAAARSGVLCAGTEGAVLGAGTAAVKLFHPFTRLSPIDREVTSTASVTAFGMTANCCPVSGDGYNPALLHAGGFHGRSGRPGRAGDRSVAGDRPRVCAGTGRGGSESGPMRPQPGEAGATGRRDQRQGRRSGGVQARCRQRRRDQGRSESGHRALRQSRHSGKQRRHHSRSTGDAHETCRLGRCASPPT